MQKMKDQGNSEPKQTHQSKYVLSCLSIAGNSAQCVMLAPKQSPRLRHIRHEKDNGKP